MSILSQAKPDIPNTPLIITLMGTPGSGKTTTACTFPSPFLVRTTGESVPRDLTRYGIEPPVSLGVTDTEQKLIEQLSALLREDHPYKTLIIDSITGLESMFIAEVIAADPKAQNIQQAAGGFGGGRDTVAAKHMRVRKAAEMLRVKKNMNVVFVAHSDITTVSPPDGDSYSQYSLRLHNKSQAPYVDEVDLVGFIKQPTALIGEGRKRAIGQDERVLMSTMTPASITKNRLGITEDIDVELGKNPLAKFLGNRKPAKVAAKVTGRVSVAETQDGDIVPTEEFTADDFVEGAEA